MAEISVGKIRRVCFLNPASNAVYAAGDPSFGFAGHQAGGDPFFGFAGH